MARLHGEVQGRVAVAVASSRVGALRQEEPSDGFVARADGAVEG